MAIQDLFPQKSQFDTINLALMAISSKIGGSLPISDPRYIKAVCDAGQAQKVFNVGDQIKTPHMTSLTNSYKNLSGTAGITGVSVTEATFIAAIQETKSDYEFIYDGTAWSLDGSIVDISHYGITYTGTAKKDDVIIVHEVLSDYTWDIAHVSSNGIYLLMHDCIMNLQFDAPEALIYFPSALAPGNYAFASKYGRYGAGTEEDAVYYFTTTVQIPAGGYLRSEALGQYSASYSKDRVKAAGLKTYNSSETLLENVSIAGYADTTPGGYTLLGTVSGRYLSDRVAGSLAVDNLNITQPNVYGKAHYGESAARQMLNSNLPKGTYLEKKNNFDMKPSWASSQNGFRYGLDKIFDSVVSTSSVVCGTNPSFGTGTYVCNDKYFLASRIEMGYGIESGWQEGSVLDMYNGVPNSKKIKYLSGNARYWWLRSPYPSAGLGHYERFVYSGGSLNYDYARDSRGLVPACIIGVI